MKSFAGLSAVTKEKDDLADLSPWLEKEGDLNFLPGSDARQWITRRITNSSTDFYPRVTATDFCLTHRSELPTFHGLYVFTGRPHKFYILIFVKISARQPNGARSTNLAQTKQARWSYRT